MNAVFAELNKEIEKEEVFQLHEANFDTVGTPTFGTPFCTQGEKDNALVAISRERANAGFNINQADQVIWSIEAAQKTAKSDKGKQVLATKLTAAKADRTARTKELDKLDALYEAAKKLPVEDCTNGAGNALGMPTIGLSAHRDLGTKVYAPNLKKYELPTLKACYDNETERQRAAWEAQKAGGNALHNYHEWNKRRRSIEDAIFKGEGNQAALKAAQQESIIEAKKWDDKNKKADELAKEADQKPLCPKSQDNRTSMNAPSNNQKLLESLQRMTGNSPWEQDLGVIVPPVYTGDHDASAAAARGNRSARHNMRRAGALQNQRNTGRGMPNNTSSNGQNSNPAPRTLNIPAGSNGTIGSTKPKTETIPNGSAPAASQQPTNTAGTQNMAWPGSKATQNAGAKVEVQPTQNNRPINYNVGNSNLTTQRAGTNVEVQHETSGQTNNNQETWVQVKPPVLVIPASPQN